MPSISQQLRQGNYAKLLRTYNARDQLIEETMYDPQGQPTRDEDGYVTARFTYDSRGYRIETAYFDENNHPTLHTDGYTKFLTQYNDKGQLVEQAYVGLDGAYVLHKEGHAKVRLTYNERGKVAQRTYFDPQDRLVQTRLRVRHETLHLRRPGTRNHADVLRCARGSPCTRGWWWRR